MLPDFLNLSGRAAHQVWLFHLKFMRRHKMDQTQLNGPYMHQEGGVSG